MSFEVVENTFFQHCHYKFSEKFNHDLPHEWQKYLFIRRNLRLIQTPHDEKPNRGLITKGKDNDHYTIEDLSSLLV